MRRRVAGGPRLVALAGFERAAGHRYRWRDQARVSRLVRSAVREIAAGHPEGLAKLRAFNHLGARDGLAWAYAGEWDPIRRGRLADAYKELTGEDVDARLARLLSD